MRADRRDEGGDRDGGLAANAEAIALLVPSFQRLPAAFAPRMAGMIQEYRQRCAALGRAPDADLIDPLAAILAALGHEQEESS